MKTALILSGVQAAVQFCEVEEEGMVLHSALLWATVNLSFTDMFSNTSCFSVVDIHSGVAVKVSVAYTDLGYLSGPVLN